jgi:hypothetical protein
MAGEESFLIVSLVYAEGIDHAPKNYHVRESK